MRVSVNQLTFAYINKLVLNKLSFNLKSGEFLLIHGRNGSGKSTLIKCLLKFNKVNNGMVLLDDVCINSIKRFSNIGYVPQKSAFNFEFPITVAELLTCAYQSKKDENYYKIIDELDLKEFYKENVNNLSGGQIQRVFIARALINNPKLLILDEPTVGVDECNVKSLHDILLKLKQKEITIILITHDFGFCSDLADYTLTLMEGGEYDLRKVEV